VVTVFIVNTNITTSGPLSFCSGGSVTFTAAILQNATYQWYYNGALQSGQTASTYVLSTPLANDQIYVTDPKWNCVNFNIDDYESQNDLEYANAEEDTRHHSFVMVNQRQGKKDLKKYSVDKFFDKMYVPALNIKIGDYSDGMTMNLLEVEKRLDAVVDDILFDIPHSDIIWDSARFKRRFDPNINIYQYNIKVILK
jgi:hypothetical protein